MPPSKKKKRFEVHFEESDIKKIKKEAKKEGRSVKNWMESKILKAIK